MFGFIVWRAKSRGVDIIIDFLDNFYRKCWSSFEIT